MSLWQQLVEWLQNLFPRPRPTIDDASRAFREELFHLFPFTAEVQDWFRHEIGFQVQDHNSTTGGGGWYPHERAVRLNTVQYEAAIHELAHAWWHDRRHAQKDALVAAVERLAQEVDDYPPVGRVAHDYIHGIPTQPGFEQGMLLPREEWGTGGGPRDEWNDWEMYAGLASGCMADIRLLPHYLRSFYTGLFELLPDDAPVPTDQAPHR
jgi:hypothetical protein